MNGYYSTIYGTYANPKTSNGVWSYSREITINPITPSNNYQIKVELNSSIFNYGSANLDGSDIRFFDASNNSLDYWIENWNTTGTSIIWVEVLNSGTPLINMRYGNSEAISESSGDNTFIFFDDFENVSIDSNKWYLSGVTGYAIADGRLNITYYDMDGDNLLTTANPLNVNSCIIEYHVDCDNDFRINLFCSQTPIKRSSGGGNWYMVLAPWAYDQSRIDWFTDGSLRSPNIITGAPYYTNYRGTLKVKYNNANNQQLWLTTTTGSIFNNILLNKFTTDNTYLSLSTARIAYLSFIAIRLFNDIDPIIHIGPELPELDPPTIEIISPIDSEIFGTTAPTYDLSVTGLYDVIWYTLDSGATNITASSLTGTLNQAAWTALADGIKTIIFFANNSAGMEGTAQVQVIKDSSVEPPPPAIPGYNFYIMLGALGIVPLILIKRRFRSR